MVSAPDSGWNGLGSSLGQRHCVEFLGKTHSNVTVPLSTQVYKSVPANLMLAGGGGGANPAMD